MSRADRDACNSERVGAKPPPARERQPSRRKGRPKPLGDDLGGTLSLCNLLSEGVLDYSVPWRFRHVILPAWVR